MKRKKIKEKPTTFEDLLKEITRFGEKSGLKRVRIKVDEMEAEVEFHSNSKKSTSTQANAPQPKQHTTAQTGTPTQSAETYESDPKLRVIKSPLVGTFYRAPSPSSKPFVERGDRVEKGTTLAIVEAMKLMNELECEYSGVIEKVLVDNGTPIEFDQPLFVLSI